MAVWYGNSLCGCNDEGEVTEGHGDPRGDPRGDPSHHRVTPVANVHQPPSAKQLPLSDNLAQTKTEYTWHEYKN